MLNRKDRMMQMQGFKETEKVLNEERIRRLRGMSPVESLRIYDDLCEFYYSLHPLPEETSGEKLAFLVRRRQLLNKLGGAEE